jgi:hypothetical protein
MKYLCVTTGTAPAAESCYWLFVLAYSPDVSMGHTNSAPPLAGLFICGVNYVVES